MIPIRPERWLHYGDLARDLPGREEDPEVIEQCWGYLREAHGNEAPASDAGARTASELIAAKLRASAGRSRNAATVEARLAAQESAINRLLAFVPVRARAIEPDRLQDIVRRVSVLASDFFAGTVVWAVPESDTDTAACHRVVVEVDAPEDPYAFVRAEMELHKKLAEMTRPEEFEAVRLIVETRG